MKRKTDTSNENLLFPLHDESAEMPNEALSDEFCCELLAWFHACGGCTEAVVSDNALSTALRTAGERLHMEGGGTPPAGLLQLLLEKMTEAKKSLEKDFPPAWILKITTRYNLPKPRRGIDY